MRSNLVMYILILLFVFTGCSVMNNQSAETFNEFESKIFKKVEPKWFRGPERFRVVDQQQEPIAHMYFDMNPEVSLKTSKVNYIIETPAQSRFRYHVDIPSGQHYYFSNYCEQETLYGEKGATVNTPNFSEGFIPRYLDQLGLPQKVIVFGNEENIRKNYKSHYFRGKVVAGYREQICTKRRCNNKNGWLSRLVLVLIDESLENDIKTLDSFKEMFDWKYTKAFIENGQGHSKVGTDYYQKYLVSDLISKEEALQFFEKRSTFFSIEKLKQMRLSCFKLYDHIWEQLGVSTEDDKVAKSKKELIKKAEKSIQQRDLFHFRFREIMDKYGEEFSTCSKYVYPTNINVSKERHWLFAYLTGFSRLNDHNEYYSCTRNRWFRAYFEGQRQSNELDSCTKKDIKTAFYSVPKQFQERHRLGFSALRYIDYDTSLRGSRKKVYSWIKWNNTHNRCSDINKVQKQELPAFPEDVNLNVLPIKKRDGFLGDIIY